MSGAAVIAAFALRESLRRRVFTVVGLLTIAFLALYSLGTWQLFDTVGEFDEPTSALDPAGRRTVRRLLEDLRDRGVAVLLNSHLLSEVELVCDRVAIIARGELVAAGTPDELSSASGVEVETANGTRVFERAGREEAPRIVRELVEAGEEIYGVRVLRSSLEDAYLEAVGES